MTLCPHLPQTVLVNACCPGSLFIVAPFTLKHVILWTINYMAMLGYWMHLELYIRQQEYNFIFSSYVTFTKVNLYQAIKESSVSPFIQSFFHSANIFEHLPCDLAFFQPWECSQDVTWHKFFGNCSHCVLTVVQPGMPHRTTHRLRNLTASYLEVLQYTAYTSQQQSRVQE